MRSSLLVSLAFILASSPAVAAERWVDRPMTLHRLVFAGDVGIGIGHVQNRDPGTGLNLEAALGITERIELGLRTGIRFGNDGRAIGADAYGRTLWTETYNVNGDTVANPEFRFRWVAYSGSVAEVGLDARLMMPVEDNSRLGVMFGVPLAFHVADFMRIDTGVYLPVAFYDPLAHGFAIPAYFWFQASEKLWLGPMARVLAYDGGPGDLDTRLLLGFGLGYQVARAVDIKTMALVPAADDGFDRGFGAGFGVQFRIGD